MRRPLARRIATIAAAACASACGFVIGLEDRAARAPSTEAGVVDAPIDAGVEASPTFCSNEDALFCEDFDQPGQGFEKWIGYPPAPGYSSGGEAGAAIVEFDAAPSAPSVVAYNAQMILKARSAVFLATNLSAPGARGVELSFKVSVAEFVDDVTVPREAGAPVDGGNPDYDLEEEAQCAVGGIGAAIGGEPSAALFVFTSRSLALSVVKNQTSSLTLGGATDFSYGRIGPAGLKISAFGEKLYTGVTILIGESQTVRARARALFHDEPSCPDSAAVAIGGTDVTIKETKCIAARDEFANIGDLPILVSSGASLIAPGRVRVRADNIVVRALFGP